MTEGHMVPRSKYSNLADRGRDMIAAATAEALDTGGDTFSVFLAYAESSDIPASTVAEVTAILTRINLAARDKKPMPLIGGQALNQEEQDAVFAVRGGEIKFDAQGNLIGAQQITALKDTLTRLEHSLPGMQAMGATDDLVARLNYIVQELQRSRPASTPQVDVAAKQEEARRDLLDELGIEIGEQRVTSMTVNNFKAKIVSAIQALKNKVQTLTTERDAADRKLREVSDQLGDIVGPVRGNNDSPYDHILKVLARLGAARASQANQAGTAQRATPPPATPAQPRQENQGPVGGWTPPTTGQQQSNDSSSASQPQANRNRGWRPFANPGN